MTITYESVLERGFYPVAFLVTIVTLFAAVPVVGLASAIKGGYVLLGLCLASVLSSVVSARSSEDDAANESSEVASSALFAKLVVSAWLAGVCVTLLSGDRLYGLLLALPLGYALLGAQFVRGGSPRSLLFQTGLLFAFGPLTKYLTTGFYFGDTDIFAHVRFVDDLLATGQLTALARYEQFPGYHLFASTVRAATGLPTYDAILLSQILLYVVLLLGVFLIVRSVTGDARVACTAALATTFVSYVSFFTTIGFPQTIATLLVVLLLYVASRASDPILHTRLFLLGLLLGAGLVLTHHLTILLFMPLVLFVLAVQYLLKRVPADALARPGGAPFRSFVLLVPGAAALSYWVYDQRFLLEVSYFFLMVFVGGLFVTEGELAETTFAFGQRLPPISAESAFYSLFSLEGIYFILLVGVFVVGVRRLLFHPLEYPSLIGFCAIGLAAALLVFPTPFAAQFDRIRLPLSLFFAIVLALGLLSAIRLSDRTISVGLALALIVALGTLTPIAAGDDLYGVHEGENLYEQRPLPQPERDLAAAEYDQLRSIAEFSESTDQDVGSLSSTHRAFVLFGAEEPTGDAVVVSEDGFETDHELFVYRDRWTDHRMPHSYWEQQLTITMSEEWLEQTKNTENKVYAADDTGVLWQRDGGVIGENVSQSVDTG